jgi:uncharacterized RDD family membrane protein YckC
MSSAQRDILPLDEAVSELDAAAPFALKEQVAQRLADHRARRRQPASPSAEPKPNQSPAKARSSRIAAAVAERYAQSQSYRSFLAAEAEKAIREAEAAAEVAAISAKAIADAQYELLDQLDAEINEWSLTPPAPIAVVPALKPRRDDAVAPHTHAAPHADELLLPLAPEPALAGEAPALTVRLYEPAPLPRIEFAAPSREPIQNFGDEAEGLALDEEIAFRQAPVFDEPSPTVEIPANLIEFPRQLVAPRRARPRLAEGPLREDGDQAPLTQQTAQLRIFEVEATQISTAPVVESVGTEWASILLAAHPVSAPVESTEPQFSPIPAPQAAPFSLRLMAGIVDTCIVTAALLAFTAAFATTVNKLDAHARIVPTGHMSLQSAALMAVATLAVFSLLYQLLFFTFAEATPGMRYARIGLCTLSDDNPTRSAMRRRIIAVLLAGCPIGIGFLWAWLDEDGLGWHDRISRMYQRAY